MNLDDAQQYALVAHLASRFPGFGERSAVARDAGLGDTQLTGDATPAWARLISDAVERDRLPHLLRAAARTRPNDELLLGLATSAADGALVIPTVANPRAWVRGASIAVGVVLVLGLVALMADVSGISGSAKGGGESGVESAAIAAPGSTLSIPPTEPAPTAPASTAPIPNTSAQPAPPVEAVAPAVGVEPPRPAPPTTATAGGLCPGSPTEIVGYAYAGKRAPPGASWRLTSARNVRADYPRRENRWNSRTKVICVLPQGATLRIERPPVRVDGDAYWIPVVGGAATAP